MLDWRPRVLLKVCLKIEEVHSSMLHQTNEDIYGKTVTVLCWINIYAFSRFVDLQSSNMYKDLDLSFIWGHHHLHLVGL